ncbi:MAG: hypothetical protein ACLVO2_17735 [Clostridia bacterium]
MEVKLTENKNNYKKYIDKYIKLVYYININNKQDKKTDKTFVGSEFIIKFERCIHAEINF